MNNLRLKELRINSNLSQRDLEKKISFNQSSIEKWENHKNEPSMTALIELANIFNCSIDYLVGREGEEGIIVVSGNELSKDEEHLLDITRQLPPKEKDMVYRLAETLYEYIKK